MESEPHRLLAERAHNQLGSLGAGEVLLSCDEIAVSRCEATPQAALRVDAAQARHLILYSPRHYRLAARQGAHGPRRFIGSVLLHVREAGHNLTLDEGFTGAEPRMAQDRHTVTQRAGNFARLMELDEFPMQIGRRLEGEHRTLAAGD